MAYDPYYDDSYDDEGFEGVEQEPDYEEMLERQSNRDLDRIAAIEWGGLDI